MHLLHSLLALAAAASLTSAVPAEPDEPAPQPRIYSPLNVPTKVGLAWPNSNGMPLKSFLFNGKVSWIYTWKSTIGKSDVAPDTLFCSMLWGDAGPGANLDAYIANVVRQPESYANRHKCTMAMNEVNQRGQSDMSPQHACSLIRTHMLPLKRNHGYFLVGPSVTSDPRGLTVWYKEFMSTCPDAFAAFDAISVHWYDVSTAKFKKYLQNWYAVTGKKLIVTEWACQNFNGGPQCTKDQAWSLHRSMRDFMNAADYILMYAPFGAMVNMQGVSAVNRLATYDGKRPTDLWRLIAGLF